MYESAQPCVIVISPDLKIGSDAASTHLGVSSLTRENCTEAVTGAIASGQSRELEHLLTHLEAAGVDANDVLACLTASPSWGTIATCYALGHDHAKVLAQVIAWLQRHGVGPRAAAALGARSEDSGSNGFCHAMVNGHHEAITVLLDGMKALSIRGEEAMGILNARPHLGLPAFMGAMRSGRTLALRAALERLPGLGIVDERAFELLAAADATSCNGPMAACRFGHRESVQELLQHLPGLGIVGERALRLLAVQDSQGGSLFSRLGSAKGQLIFADLLRALPHLLTPAQSLELLGFAWAELQKFGDQRTAFENQLRGALADLGLPASALGLEDGTPVGDPAAARHATPDRYRAIPLPDKERGGAAATHPNAGADPRSQASKRVPPVVPPRPAHPRFRRQAAPHEPDPLPPAVPPRPANPRFRRHAVLEGRARPSTQPSPSASAEAADAAEAERDEPMSATGTSADG